MFCLQTLREENAGLRDEVRELTGKLEEQRRAAKRKVAELENLLRHVTEELSRAGDPARGASDGGQLAEDNARLEEELNRAEARQEQMAAEYEERLRIAEAAARPAKWRDWSTTAGSPAHSVSAPVVCALYIRLSTHTSASARNDR